MKSSDSIATPKPPRSPRPGESSDDFRPSKNCPRETRKPSCAPSTPSWPRPAEGRWVKSHAEKPAAGSDPKTAAPKTPGAGRQARPGQEKANQLANSLIQKDEKTGGTCFRGHLFPGAHDPEKRQALESGARTPRGPPGSYRGPESRAPGVSRLRLTNSLIPNGEKRLAPEIRRTNGWHPKSGARRTSSKTAPMAHFRNHRCTVLFEPKRAGRSFHFAPWSRIQKMPSTTRRFSAQGRPPSLLFGWSGIRSQTQSNC